MLISIYDLPMSIPKIQAGSINFISQIIFPTWARREILSYENLAAVKS